MNATLSNISRELPNSIEAEEYLLSCCFIDGADTVARCLAGNLAPRAFFCPANQIIYGKLLDLYQRNLPIDTAIVAEELKAGGQLDTIGGYAYLAQVSSRIPTTAQAGYFVEKVANSHRLRSVILAASQLIEDARAPDADAGEITARLSAGIDGITASHSLAALTTTAAAICAKPPPRPAEIIEGVLFQSGTMMLSGPSKARKTFTFLDLALSVATGFQWLGFSTSKAPVLYLNFELSEHSFQHRVAAICNAKGIKPPANLFTLNLRGRTVTIQSLATDLPRLIKQHGVGLVVLDPWYKLSAASGADENGNADQARILAEAERIVTSNGAALVVGHHFSKGDASAKNAIDRAAGAGAMARWGDVIATLSEHVEPDCMTLEMFLRDFPPVEPVVLHWEMPLWQRDISLDPAKLKRSAGRRETYSAADLLGKLIDGMTNREWFNASSLSSDTTYRRKRDELTHCKPPKVVCVMGTYRRA